MINDPKWATDQEFKNKFAEQKGLIIGRGTHKEYQRNKDLDSFDGIKIGCNSAYRAMRINILVWMDPHFFESHWMEIASLDCFKFAVEPIHYNHHWVDIRGLKARRPERCSDSFDAGFYPCNLSGFIALNVAMLLGLNPVWLYGFNPDTKILQERSKNFRFIADWANKYNRQIYITDKGSSLEEFFRYKPLVQQSASRRIVNV